MKSFIQFIEDIKEGRRRDPELGISPTRKEKKEIKRDIATKNVATRKGSYKYGPKGEYLGFYSDKPDPKKVTRKAPKEAPARGLGAKPRRDARRY